MLYCTHFKVLLTDTRILEGKKKEVRATNILVHLTVDRLKMRRNRSWHDKGELV